MKVSRTRISRHSGGASRRDGKRGWSLRVRTASLAALFVCPLFSITVAPVQLSVHGSANELTVSAPNFHFLTGKALDRLHDGLSVPFDAQLSLVPALMKSAPQTSALQRAFDRFVVSYDLWEEKFSVTSLREPRTSASHLTAAAAEAWCLENLRLPLAGVNSAGDLRLRLELRSAETKETNPLLADAGISLTGLIEVFSRPPRSQQQKWMIESAPFRLLDLKKS